MEEKELKEFFITVANYSLPENIEKYLESLNGIPETSSHYGYAAWLFNGLEYTSGRAKVAPSAYKRGVSLFTESGFKSFEQLRKGLVKVLEQISSSGKSVWEFDWEFDGLGKIVDNANILKPETAFVLRSDARGSLVGKVELYPEKPEKAVTVLKGTKDNTTIRLKLESLDGIFHLACYSLSAFLVDLTYGGRKRIKKCPHCQKFFIAKDTRRLICYEATCRNEYHKEDMKKRREEDPVKYC